MSSSPIFRTLWSIAFYHWAFFSYSPDTPSPLSLSQMEAGFLQCHKSLVHKILLLCELKIIRPQPWGLRISFWPTPAFRPLQCEWPRLKNDTQAEKNFTVGIKQRLFSIVMILGDNRRYFGIVMIISNNSLPFTKVDYSRWIIMKKIGIAFFCFQNIGQVHSYITMTKKICHVKFSSWEHIFDRLK